MSHSRREQTYRDLRDSRPTQAERDREATEIIREIADDEGAIVESVIDDDTTGRVQIASMDARLAELVDAHDASEPPFPEFARRDRPCPCDACEIRREEDLLEFESMTVRRRMDGEYDIDDFRAGLDVTQTDLPALPAQEPTWGQVLRMGIVDVAKEVL